MRNSPPVSAALKHTNAAARGALVPTNSLCIPVGDNDDIGDDIGDELVYIRSYTVVSSECIDNTQAYMYTHVYKQTNI
jgi:hypothetical protein